MESQCLELHRNTYKMWLWIFTGVIMISSVLGFSNGNFPQVCRSMAPQHFPFGTSVLQPPQTTPAPYNIFYAYGQREEPVTVTLQSTAGSYFRGFMLEARQKGKEDPVGNFTVLDPTKTRILTCKDVSGFAVSQKNNVKKTSIQVNWTTDVFDQDITFRATVLHNFTVFWNGVEVKATFTPTTPVPSTQPTTTTSTTSTATTMPSTTSTTETRATSTASTTEPSTTGSTESSTASTTESSTTGSTESVTTGTTEPSTTSTTSTTEPSTTGRTSWPCCRPRSFWKKVATALVVLDTLFVVMKMELVPSSFQNQIKMSASLCSLMSMAAELLALMLFCLDGPGPTINIIALVCVVIVVNFTEVLIITQPFQLHHKLKGISSQVCSVIHIIFSIAVIFVVLLESDCLWPLIVMIAYTVWLFVFVIWVFFISTRRKAEPGRHNIEDSKNNRKSKYQREKMTSTLAKVTIIAVSVFFIVGTMTFTAAVIFLVFSPNQD